MTYLTTADASLALGIERDTLRRLCLQGKVPGAQFDGYRWQIPEEYVEGLVFRDYESIKDVLGKPVPDFLSDVFKSKQLLRIVRHLNQAISELSRVKKWNPFVPEDLISEFIQLRNKVSGIQVTRVCICDGLGCPACRGHGWLPRNKAFSPKS